jgi:hypothetical protein
VVPYLFYVVCVELCHVAGLLRFHCYGDEDQMILPWLRAQQTAFLGFPLRRVGRCYWCAGSAFVHGELDVVWLKRYHIAWAVRRMMDLLTRARVLSHCFNFLLWHK